MGKYSIDANSAFEKIRAQKEFCAISDKDLLDRLGRIADAYDSYISSLSEDAYFDDDEAFDAVCQTVCGNEEALDTAQLVSAYMEINDSYLEALGLIEWE